MPMRKWLRKWWKWVLGAVVFVLVGVALGLQRVVDTITKRKDDRTDRALNEAHDQHVAHEGKADALEAQAVEVEREREPIPDPDLSNMSAAEAAERFKEIYEERHK